MNPIPARIFSFIANFFYSQEIMAMIHDLIAPAEGMNLLDAPCGTGTLFDICVPCNYYGTDLDQHRVEEAGRMNPSGTFVCASSSKLPFPDAYFDRILAAGLFHHVDDVTAEQILQEYSRLVRPGGFLIVYEAIWPLRQYNLWGRLVRKMDQGNFVRHVSGYDQLFNRYFDIAARSHPFRLGVDYYLAMLTVKK